MSFSATQPAQNEGFKLAGTALPEALKQANARTINKAGLDRFFATALKSAEGQGNAAALLRASADKAEGLLRILSDAAAGTRVLPTHLHGLTAEDLAEVMDKLNAEARRIEREAA
jgi:limonene-1,2-epoxide hydrolase